MTESKLDDSSTMVPVKLSMLCKPANSTDEPTSSFGKESILQVSATRLTADGVTPFVNDRVQDTCNEMECVSVDQQHSAADKPKEQTTEVQTMGQTEHYSAYVTGSFSTGLSGPHSLPGQVCALEKTTLMIRNIPHAYTQEELLLECPTPASYDFFYLPFNNRLQRNLMYAFINFTTAEAALKFKNHWQGRTLASYLSQKSLNIGFADVQGRDENLRQLRKKRLLRTNDKGSQPLVFRNGERIPFEIALAELDAGNSSLADQRVDS